MVDPRRAARDPRSTGSSATCPASGGWIEHGVALLHDDRDFDLIASVVPELRLA
jgi:hypothetical protein